MPPAEGHCRRPAEQVPREGRRRGLTLVAAILSLLLLLLLVALVASAVWTARGAAKRAACKTNLEKLVSALMLYRESNDGFPPDQYEVSGDDVSGARPVGWRDLIARGVGDDRAFTCPADEAAAAAEAARPPGSRGGATACSYDYVYWQQSESPDSGSGRGGRISGRAPFAVSATERPAPLLVCRHHDTSDEDSAPWGLVAYEDGSIVWEQIPGPHGRGPLIPAGLAPETGPIAAGGATPPATRGSSARTSHRRLASESGAASSDRRGDSGSRRSR